MAASVGTLTGFSGWTGKYHLAVRRMAKIPPRPGVNGEAWVYDGWTTAADAIVTRHISVDQTAADTSIAIARAYMNGTTITSVDPEGRSWQVKVINVIPETFVRSNGGILVVLAWTNQVEAAP